MTKQEIGITATANLTNMQKTEVNELMEKIHQHDGTCKDPYLSNQYSYFPEMPIFISAYESGALVGFVMIYADEKPNEEVDLYVEILPEKRRQGIAKKLVVRVKQILTQYNYSNIFYIAEQNFLKKNDSFLSANILEVDNESLDYYMETTNPTVLSKNDSLSELLMVVKMAKQDIAKVVNIYSEAFGESQEASQMYVTQGYKDDKTLCFLLKKQDKIIGYCCVDCSKTAYFYGLFIAKGYRGHGYGTYFIKKMMELLQGRGVKVFALDVELNNPAAVQTYQNAGFKIKSEVVYLKEKK